MSLNFLTDVSSPVSSVLENTAALKAAVQEAAASLEGQGASGGDSPYGGDNYYYYDRSKSFYDKISCTSIEKMRQQFAQPVVAPAPCESHCFVYRRERNIR